MPLLELAGKLLKLTAPDKTACRFKVVFCDTFNCRLEWSLLGFFMKLLLYHKVKHPQKIERQKITQ